MCKLTKHLLSKEVTVYKAALESKTKEDQFYSVAMGFRYEIGPVPIITIQKSLTDHFKPDLLVFNFKNNMEGRTAGFLDPKDAFYLAASIKEGNIFRGYKCVVLKVKLTDSLMSGTYEGDKVIAGKRILSMEEINQFELCQKNLKVPQFPPRRL